MDLVPVICDEQFAHRRRLFVRSLSDLHLLTVFIAELKNGKGKVPR